MKFTEKTKSMIRHLLTAIGVVLSLVGLNDFIPVLDYLQGSLDQVWDAIVVLIGFITTVWGFLRKKERFNILETVDRNPEILSK